MHGTIVSQIAHRSIGTKVVLLIYTFKVMVYLLITTCTSLRRITASFIKTYKSGDKCRYILALNLIE